MKVVVHDTAAVEEAAAAEKKAEVMPNPGQQGRSFGAVGGALLGVVFLGCMAAVSLDVTDPHTRYHTPATVLRRLFGSSSSSSRSTRNPVHTKEEELESSDDLEGDDEVSAAARRGTTLSADDLFAKIEELLKSLPISLDILKSEAEHQLPSLTIKVTSKSAVEETGDEVVSGLTPSQEPGFVFVSTPKTFDDAQKDCEVRYNGTLALVTSEKENAKARDVTSAGGCDKKCKTWIGLKKSSGSYRWTGGPDQEVRLRSSRAKWTHGQPDNYANSENCAMFCDPRDHWCHHETEWADYGCGEKLPYVCSAWLPEEGPKVASVFGTVPGLSAWNGAKVTVLSGNLFWWNLFQRRGGENGRMGKLYQGNGPVDLYGLQECDDVYRVRRESRLEDSHGAKQFGHALAIMWDKSQFGEEPLDDGCDPVAKDKPGFWGRRYICWARFQHVATKNYVWFGTFHGPLPVSSGGAYGSTASVENKVQLLEETAQPGDLTILLGDFNNAKWSNTVTKLKNHMDRVSTDYGGHHWSIDHIFVNKGLTDASPDTHAWSIGTGGSDHPQVKAEIVVP